MKLAEEPSSTCIREVEPDGLIFDPTSIHVTQIRETEEYPGQRLRLKAFLGKAEISLQGAPGYKLNISDQSSRWSTLAAPEY